MTEPPLRVSSEGVDPEPRKTGHRYLDLFVAGAAILISCISLAVAVKHGMIMDRLVAANSWPLLQYNTGNIRDEDGSPEISMAVENAGVGPAVVRYLSLIYRGKRYSSARDFIEACCSAPADGARRPALATSFIESSVIKPGEEALYLKLGDEALNSELWKRLDQARFEVRFDVCYCSVFGECWRSDLVGVNPRPVNSCPAPIGLPRRRARGF